MSDYKEGEIWVVGWGRVEDFVCEITKSNFNEHIVVRRLVNDNPHYLSKKDFKIFLGINKELARLEQSMHFI